MRLRVLIAPAFFLFATCLAHAGTIAPGWDLFQTDPNNTSFPGLGNLHGVPEGFFDFGGTIGVKNTSASSASAALFRPLTRRT